MVFQASSVLFAGNFGPEALAMFLGGLAFLLVGLIILLVILIVAIYIYTSLAYMAIARKVKYSPPGIAWIPIVGPLIIIAKTAKMHWWPILLLILIPVPFIGSLAFAAVMVFSILWLWKTYEKMRRPGWWSLFNLIQPVNLVFLGIAAWSKK